MSCQNRCLACCCCWHKDAHWETQAASALSPCTLSPKGAAQLSDLHPWDDNLTYGHCHLNLFSIAGILTLSSLEKRVVCFPLEMQSSTDVTVLSTAAVLLQTVISGIIVTKYWKMFFFKKESKQKTSRSPSPPKPSPSHRPAGTAFSVTSVSPRSSWINLIHKRIRCH